MTAANAFSRPDAAWLFFDTAFYDAAGWITRFKSKVACSDRFRLAIGVCGRTPPNCEIVIQHWLDEQPTQRAALEGLPELLATLGNAADAAPSYTHRWRWRIWSWLAGVPLLMVPGIRLSVAWWDYGNQCGQAAIITDERDDLDGGYPPGVLHPVRGVSSPSPRDAHWQWPKGEFDPETDALTLAERQRRTPNDGGGYRVGGAFESYRVHAGGIDRTIVCEWLDRVDEPIRLAA